MRTQFINNGDFWYMNYYLGYVGVSHRNLVKYKVSMNQSSYYGSLTYYPYIILRIELFKMRWRESAMRFTWTFMSGLENMSTFT